MEIDGVLREIGESGPQQLRYGALLCLVKLYHPLHTLQYTFVARHTQFTCATSSASLNSSCPANSAASCSSLGHSEDTIVSEWGLVCDLNWYSKATMSALMLGFLLGSLGLGWLSDRIGRKRNLMVTLAGLLATNLVSAATPHYSVYLVSRFLIGIFLAGNILSAVTLLNELVGPSYRGLYCLALMASFSLGIVLLSLLASRWQHSWRGLTFIVSILGLPLLLLQRSLVESPRWLLAQGRPEEAEAVLLTIARGNGVTAKLDIALQRPAATASCAPAAAESVSALVTQPRLLPVSLILGYCWFVVGGCYYGLTLAAGSMGTSVYTGTALSGLVELPAVLLIYPAIESRGRRTGVIAFLALAGTFCLGIKIMPESMTTLLALCGKLCIAAAFNVVYIISSEIFATTIRNSALGLASALARVGAIMAPFVVMLGEVAPGQQFLIFGLFCLSGGLLGCWLPETRGQPLPESVREMMVDREKKETLHI